MISGEDLKDYRRRLGLTQTEIAERVRIPQQTYSNLETGKIQVNAERIAQFKAAFDHTDADPSFSRFLEEIEAAARQRTPALESPLARQVAVTVWRWADLRLDRIMPAEAAVGIVMIPFTDRRVIAVQMDADTELWKKGEILVFAEGPVGELDDRDIALASVPDAAGAGSKVEIGTVTTRDENAKSLLVQPSGLKKAARMVDLDEALFVMQLASRVVHLST